MKNKADKLEVINRSLIKFIRWLGRNNYESYDQYDLWATTYGIWCKGLYYRSRLMGAPFVIPLGLVDWLFPSLRKWMRPKTRFPIADAHYLMGFIELYKIDKNEAHLTKAEEIANYLLTTSISGYSGYCWGYPFDWQSKRGLWVKGTPLITTTPYIFNAYLELYDVTGNQEYIGIAKSIAEFVAYDIKDTPVGRGCAASYTPLDDSQVVNASAYRAGCLTKASEIFKSDQYRQLAIKNVNFVLDQQRENGSWFYSANDPQDFFVDNIHTCFVLKGLYQCYKVLKEDRILKAVKKGFDYYRKNLLSSNGMPRTFSETNNGQFKVVELYDFAEAINLCLLIEKDILTDGLADLLVNELLETWKTPEGYFMTRLSKGGIRNLIPYHRWGQSQIFRSLTLYYNREKGH